MTYSKKKKDINVEKKILYYNVHFKNLTQKEVTIGKNTKFKDRSF